MVALVGMTATPTGRALLESTAPTRAEGPARLQRSIDTNRADETVPQATVLAA